MGDPLGIDLAGAWRVAISAAGAYVAILAYARIAGLRSFAQISAFDFAMTVAVGSILASAAVTSSATLADAVVALGTLFLLQGAVGVGRRHSAVAKVVDNRPRVLVARGQVVERQLAEARLTHADLHAKLRGAGVHRLADVDAVVLETTGTISIIQGGEAIDPVLLEGVLGAEALAAGEASDEPSDRDRRRLRHARVKVVGSVALLMLVALGALAQIL